jgi:hypothetical protein
MISFDLRCKNDHVFETWFANSGAYDSQMASGEVTCPVCGDHHLSKALMAPNVSAGKGRATEPQNNLPVAAANSAGERAAEIMRLARALRSEVEKNFDYVGSAFAEEAKKIHYGEVERRDIYGEMTGDEAEALNEEGVEFGVLPWPTKEDA